MEEYRDIKGYEGIYQVSNFGNVRRVYKKKKGFGIMKPINHSGGYSRLKLRNKGNDKDVYIHRLVAEAFLENPKEHVNHKDGNKKNNSVENLEWCNVHENVSHSMKNRNSVSKYAGVQFDKSRGKYYTRLMIKGVRVWLGTFNCETKAHLAYLNGLKSYGITNIYA